MTTMKITIGNITARAELLEKEAPVTCARMKQAMPIEGMLTSAKICDNEVLFSVPFFIDLDQEENERLVVPGDIGFWNVPQTICIFYDEPKGVLGPMGIWARIIENLEGFKREANKVFANQGTRIRFELEGQR
jgi:hypothetical protein